MNYTPVQSGSLILLRLAIGWHFLYEGGVKILNPDWTLKSYLLDSAGFLKDFFIYIAQHQALPITVKQDMAVISSPKTNSGILS